MYGPLISGRGLRCGGAAGVIPVLKTYQKRACRKAYTVGSAEPGRNFLALNLFKLQQSTNPISRAAFLFLALFLCMQVAASNATFPNNTTVRKAIEIADIPANLFLAQDLDKEISSGTLQTTPFGKVFAYYVVEPGARSLSEFFYLLIQRDSRWSGGRVDATPAAANKWFPKTADLNKMGSFVGDEICEFGLGSVFLASNPRYLILSGHFSPSASCTWVLDRGLNVVSMFSAVSTRTLQPQTLLVTDSTIHFSPVHPLRMRIVDLSNNTSRVIYPPQPEGKLRAHYRKQLAVALALCENDPVCWQRAAQDNVPLESNDISEYATVQYNANLDALLLHVRPGSDQIIGFATLKVPELPSLMQARVLIYRDLHKAKVSDFIELSQKEFVRRFGEAALTQTPTAELLDAL